MKKIALTAFCLASQTILAATPIDGWYASVFGGVTQLPNNISNTRDGLTRTDANYQGGYNAGGRIGYQSNPIRYEGELTYLDAGIHNFKVDGTAQTGLSGYSNAALGMANIYYDIPPLIPCIQPFLGAGIGYAWVNAKLGSTGPDDVTTFKESNSVFAYQATAGLTYNFAEDYALNLAYRYIATERADRLGKIFQANLASLGAVYRFDGANYK